MGDAAARRVAAGRAIATALGWPFADGEHPLALHGIAAAVLGRREHLLAVTPPFSEQQQQVVRGELLQVRFVDLDAQPGDTASLLGDLQREFGI